MGGLAFSSVSAGWEHSCGVTRQSQIYCWGRNNHGKLGDGTTTNRNAPVAVLSPDPRAVAISFPSATSPEAPHIAPLRTKADRGDAHAQFTLGQAYENGTVCSGTS